MKLALTGGPSGGKTTLATAIQAEFPTHALVVPEAASIVYGGGWPRRRDSALVKYQQRAIYYLQRELEGLFNQENPGTLLVCDRGSLDGLAYWPGLDADDFMSSIRSNIESELRRYDWVIHLDTAPVAGYDTANTLRTETWDEAWRLNEKVKEAWSAHPRRFLIPNAPGSRSGDFLAKLKRALGIVEAIVQGRSYEQIISELAVDDWSGSFEC